eukprot:9384356-Lingulodinium_polyedra.AAC.1
MNGEAFLAEAPDDVELPIVVGGHDCVGQAAQLQVPNHIEARLARRHVFRAQTQNAFDAQLLAPPAIHGVVRLTEEQACHNLG